MSAGDKNAYYCRECRDYIVTIDLAQGVTPMMLACRVKGEPRSPENLCTGMMVSMMYPEEPWPSHDDNGTEIPTQPTWEWYAPDPVEYRTLDEGLTEHVDKGGLLLRRRDATDR